ncbi:MAG: alpha/beta hydrolase [Chloroflexi bacterium]|nr:alpha/beta hydrolase [Chloroflexota bacterium]
MTSVQEQLTVKTGPISAQVVKRGQGEPLVYLHGAFGYRGWPVFLERLSERFTVYAPLHPGFGETDDIEAIDDLLDLTLYHYDLLEALGLESPNILGHYFGAMIAAEMAALRPHSVGKLVLASPTGLWREDAPGVDIMATPLTDLRKALFSDPDSDAAAQAFPQPKDDVDLGTMHIERVRSLSTVGKFLWPIPDKGLKKRLHRIKSPTLVIVGEDDRVVPPVYGEEMASRIPGARLEVMKGAGHMLMFEKPSEFARLVAGFLESS